MKQKNLKFVLLILLFSKLFMSCEKDSLKDSLQSQEIQPISQLKIVNGTIVINNKASLIDMMKQYQKNDLYQKQFDNEIVKLQNQGFKPLTPIFDNYSDEETAQFVKRKLERIKKRNLDFGIYSKTGRAVSESIVSLSDDIILDPAFAALLNEDREIVVEDKLYKYTEIGLFITDEEKKLGLDTYLNALTPEQRMAMVPITQPNLPCDNGLSPLSLETLTEDITLYQAPQLPPCVPQWNGNVGNGVPTPVPQTYAPPANLIKGKLPVCNVEAQGFWEQIFGVTEECSYFLNDDRCVSTVFWNQNFFIFSSIGCKTKFEKKKCIDLWLFSICWWEKSYPDNIELGVNYVAYDYEFNVPAYNAAAYNYETTFFSYNGINYNSSGQVIPTVPTGKGNFIFDTSSDNSIMNITVLGYELLSKDYNTAIDFLAKQLVDQMPNNNEKIELLNKIQQNKITYNVINAVPFSNKVSMISTNIRWNSSDEASLTHYFDFNFLITWNSNSSGFGDYLMGLNGATSYTNVKADVYGAALRNNQWGGSRLLYNN